KVYTSNVEPLHAELEHFINCARGGSQPSVGGEQALKALRLASQVEQIALNHNSAWREDTKVREKTPEKVLT
ncbi:MAG: gfo/Idh/MocA family oxidoreductase, partial [Cyanobacteria bacterium P01_E01_bin.48]